MCILISFLTIQPMSSINIADPSVLLQKNLLIFSISPINCLSRFGKRWVMMWQQRVVNSRLKAIKKPNPLKLKNALHVGLEAEVGEVTWIPNAKKTLMTKKKKKIRSLLVPRKMQTLKIYCQREEKREMVVVVVGVRK